MLEKVVLAALATAYVLFVFQRKLGPARAFARVRSKLASLGEFGYHLLCPTCAALSVGTLMLALAHAAPILVAPLAVAGAVMVVHGLSGHWHSADAE
ncbi:MAG: hypothetical protein RML84_09270 [Anaerolineae bacterium]|nr:hypothetical protein [Anaerolineae bacterium]